MSYVDDVLAKVIAKNPSEPEFHQAVTEVFETIRPLIEANEEEYKKQAVLERITEPERMIKFRVRLTWVSVFSSTVQSDLTREDYVFIHP